MLKGCEPKRGKTLTLFNRVVGELSHSVDNYGPLNALQHARSKLEQSREGTGGRAGAFKAERAKHAQDAPARPAGPPRAHSSRRRAGRGGHRAASGMGATAHRTEDDRGPHSTDHHQPQAEGHPNTHTYEHTKKRIDTYRGRGARGERERAGPRIKTPAPRRGHRTAPRGRAGRGSARGSGQGRAPRTFARRSGAGARQTLPTSTQRAPNEHSRPTIIGIMDNP